MKSILSVLGLLCSLAPLLAAAAEGFTWVDEPGKYTDLLHNGRKVARYVYERIDESTPARRDETYKPFHHLYDPSGEAFLTKGPGGKFPHHRGIFYGFNKCRLVGADGKESAADTWHCKKAHQTHEKFLTQEGGADHAVQRVAIDWHDDTGRVFLREERGLVFSLVPGDGIRVDFSSTVTLADGLSKVTLDGDPQHAGFQFRASGEVADTTSKQTYYVRPVTGKDAPGKTINWDAKHDNEQTTNLPWKVMSFLTGGRRYSAAYLDRPDNPKPARFSERDYGRFGSYFVSEVLPGQPVSVHYRLVIRPGEMESSEAESLSRQFVSE
ncbi:MAG: DUF6807 family protein [Verrucomicrobiales bacterium]